MVRILFYIILLVWSFLNENFFMNSIVFAESNSDIINIGKNMYGPNSYVDKGIELRKQGKYEEALDQFNKAMDMESGYLRALIQRALTYKELGKTEEAIGDFINIIKFNPEEDGAYFNLSIIYRDKGDNKKAIEYCKNALKIRKDVIFYYHLATIYEEIGEYEKARSYYEWVISSDRMNSHSTEIAKEKIKEIDELLKKGNQKSSSK